MEAKIAELKKQILETKKEASISILKKFPNNQEVRFELAQIYLEEGNYDEALPNFQKVQSNPRFRNKACMAIGQCFMEKGMLDLAAEQFKTVINETQMMDFTKKDAYYALGKCYMQQGQKQDALQCFKEIYQVDVNFRDVQQLFSQLSQSEGS
ncbi:MAG: tetratricopeptide repeat protein [Lentisphaerae bacterium]|nr:MAG: tetratricopeptide repeat protein [Lentisphaerota bacterium]